MMHETFNGERRKGIVGIVCTERLAIIQSCVRIISKCCHCMLYEIRPAVL
jgi:hypothetical protein